MNTKRRLFYLFKIALIMLFSVVFWEVSVELYETIEKGGFSPDKGPGLLLALFVVFLIVFLFILTISIWKFGGAYQLRTIPCYYPASNPTCFPLKIGMTYQTHFSSKIGNRWIALISRPGEEMNNAFLRILYHEPPPFFVREVGETEKILYIPYDPPPKEDSQQTSS